MQKVAHFIRFFLKFSLTLPCIPHALPPSYRENLWERLSFCPSIIILRLPYVAGAHHFYVD